MFHVEHPNAAARDRGSRRPPTSATPTANAVEAPTPNALAARSAMFHVEHPHAAETRARQPAPDPLDDYADP